MAKTLQEISQTVVNDNGEVQHYSEQKVIDWGSEPNYIKLYIDDILYLKDLPTKLGNVLNALLPYAVYAKEDRGVEIFLNSAIKRRIISDIGYKSLGSLDNALSQLVSGEILYRHERGVYELNPYLFGKGEWKDIAKRRIEISYDGIKGRTFKTVYEQKKANEAQETTK